MNSSDHGLIALSAALFACLYTLPGPGSAASPDDPSVLTILNATLETEKSGVEVPWSDPGNNRSGMVRVERTFFRGKTPCREYVRTVQQAGTAATEFRGTGCRMGSNLWEFDEAVSASPPAIPPPGGARTSDPAAGSSRSGGDPSPSRSGGPTPSAAAASPKSPPISFKLPTRSDP
jgi:hypothetical protein